MGNAIGFSRGLLLLALAFCWLGISVFAAADVKRRLFNIPAQPAAAALNDFAQQADVTLIFSYDLVAGVRTRSLQGAFAVSDGLSKLLDGTPLGYRQSVDGAYLICALVSCEPVPRAAPEEAGSSCEESAQE